MRPLLAILLLWVPLRAAQSVNVTSACNIVSLANCPVVAIPAGSPWTGLGNLNNRWEMRFHNMSAGPGAAQIGPFKVFVNGGTQVLLTNTINPPVTDTLGAAAPPPINPTGYADVLVRLMRNNVAQTWSLKMCNTAPGQASGGACQSYVYPISLAGNASIAGQNIAFDSGYRLAFLREFSTLVPDSDTIRVAGVTGDLLDWEFEGSLVDSVHGLTFGGAGVTVAYSTTPAFNPYCDVGTQQTFRALIPGLVSGSQSQALDNGTTLNATWTYAGPGTDGITQNSLSFGTPSALITTISGYIKGSVNLTLSLTDGTGNMASCTIHDGAVFTTANDIVVTNLDPKYDRVLGKLLRWGSPLNPIPWFDDRNKKLIDLQGAAYSTNFTPYWVTPNTGTVAVTPSGTSCGSATVSAGLCVSGTGTHFLTDVSTLTTVLNAGINNSVTSVTVANGFSIQNSVYIRIDSELLLVTAGGGTIGPVSLTCTRAQLGTAAASHSTGATVAFPGDGSSIYSYVIVWWNAGANRNLNEIRGVIDDTHLVTQQPWQPGTVESGLSYSIPPQAVVVNQRGYAQAASPGLYYDGCKGRRSLYERSGIDTYWSLWTQCADDFWASPPMDKGKAFVTGHQSTYEFSATRNQSLEGMYLRALDLQGTGSDMWPGLRIIVGYNLDLLDRAVTNGWSINDQREVAYQTHYTALDALLDPDATTANNSKAKLASYQSTLFAPGIAADGSLPTLELTIMDTAHPATVTNGSTTVTCGTCNFLTGMTNGIGQHYGTFPATAPYLVFYSGYPVIPVNNAAFRPTVYTPTVINATTLQLNIPYVEASGTVGWAVDADSGAPSNLYVVGWNSQPFMAGIQATSFCMAARAIAVSNPTQSTLYQGYCQGMAGWLKTYGYADPAFSGKGGMYYYVGSLNCSYPTQTVACTTGFNESQSRTDASEALRGLADAYNANPTPTIKAFITTIASQMYCKPGFGGSCITDGFYISDLDDGATFMSGAYQNSKWDGFFFGYSNAINAIAEIVDTTNDGRRLGGTVLSSASRL